MKQPLLLLCFLFSLQFSKAQVNDACADAIAINDVDDWCSGNGEFSNQNATQGVFDGSSCWSGAVNDVWFSFIAIAPDVTVTVNGTGGGGGTLSVPAVSLHEGECGGTISEIQCQASNNGILELYKGGLTIGQVYYIRVDGMGDARGTFQLCVNNYFLPVTPGSDCASSRSVLCDTESFSVQSVVGVGSNPTELNGYCLGGETNSSWMVFTAGENGPLEFTLSPTNANDDLDFVVFELPGGIDDCSNAIPLRCMASSCFGDTGLSLSSTDNDEEPGCNAGDDNFVAAVNMIGGKSYAIAINNFTSTGNGYAFSFDNNTLLEGPQPNFNSDADNNTICIGESLTFTDNSTAPVGDNIIGYSWNFGVGADPATASGPGPHGVTYTSVGTKSVNLTVETEIGGCIVSEVRTVVVDPCCETANATSITGVSNEVDCYDDPNGEINITVDSPFPITNYAWSNNANTEDLTGLTGGDYTVTVSNQFCETEATFSVGAPPAFVIDTVMTMATCDGGTDGSLTLNVSGATPPYGFRWFDSGTFVAGDNTRSGLAVGAYAVTVQDANGCERELALEVTELVLELDPDVDVIVEPSCSGGSDGSITLEVINGLPPYSFDFNDGNGFVGTSTLSDIPAGTYTIDIRDANGCRGTGNPFVVGEPAPLALDMDAAAVGCYGDTTGAVLTTVEGGTPPYEFNWSNGSTGTDISGLAAGVYTLTLSDSRGCTVIDSMEVSQPDVFVIGNVGIGSALCFGEASGTAAVEVFGGTAPFLYAFDTFPFGPGSVLQNIPPGEHIVSARDASGCTASAEIFVEQPSELIAAPGANDTIELGFSYQVEGQAYPLYRPVSITWTPDYNLSCNDCYRPLATPYETTTYYMDIVDSTGCADRDSITIHVEKSRPVFIPNTFTPNEDGKNDFFSAHVGPAGAIVERIQVFDRWGGVIYEGKEVPFASDLQGAGWDGSRKGKPAPEGVYIYMVRIRFVDGEVGFYQGDVTLVR